jgi:hypothetical protein
MLRVPHGARDLLQADFERKQGQKNTCWENASKIISAFALAVAAESSINYERDDTAAHDASTPSRTSPDGGSTAAA